MILSGCVLLILLIIMWEGAEYIYHLHRIIYTRKEPVPQWIWTKKLWKVLIFLVIASFYLEKNPEVINAVPSEPIHLDSRIIYEMMPCLACCIGAIFIASFLFRFIGDALIIVIAKACVWIVYTSFFFLFGVVLIENFIKDQWKKRSKTL